MTTPTATPVPSNLPIDLLFNAEKLDEALNTGALQYADRFGVQRKTLAGAVASISATNPRGAWVTATAYAARDVVSNSGTWYIALDNHTSGATFAGDQAAHWRVYQGVISSELSSFSSASQGAAYVGFDPTLNYTARTVGQALNDTEWSLMWFDAVRAAVEAGTDCTAAVAAVIALKVAAGGGGLYAPRAPSGGAWLFSGGAASPDGFKNGVLLPFSTINADASKGLQIRGEQGTVFKCNANNMILVRMARNCCTLRDLVLDANGKTSVYLCGIVPEDMTQTTTQVSQSFCNIQSVSFVGGAGCDDLVFQPGPQVGGADSGCFYHNVRDCWFNNVGGGRAVWSKKNVDWSTHPNRLTRTLFSGCRITHGNTGYQFDVGSEIMLQHCTEELITSGTTPNTSPTARYVSDDVSGRIEYLGGYSEACTLSARTPTGDKVRAFGYSFNSGGDVNEWRARASSYDDDLNEGTWTPVLASSGGGAQGSGTNTGYFRKQGRVCTFIAVINVAKGTLGAGNLSMSGFPYAANASAGTQAIPVPIFANMTLSPVANTVLGAFMAAGGFSINLRKSRNDGAGDTSLTVSECGSTISFTVQGSIITA